MIENQLMNLIHKFEKSRLPGSVLAEARKRVLDTFGCFYGAFDAKPGRLVRSVFSPQATGECSLWGSDRRLPAELAAWLNGTCVRTLDYNDTYLSKEPCHPSDLIASIWAACEVSNRPRQGHLLLQAIVLGYEVLCRLCDAKSIRVLGWDHVTYLPIASAVACSFVLGLNEDQTRHALSLATVGNNALRQTRVGTISDWKASCAAYAARSGLMAARLAKAGFTGPNDIFSGKNGFFQQVSGPFELSMKKVGAPWRIMKTHTKFFPAEHHAQSAIEAALHLRRQMRGGMDEISNYTGVIARRPQADKAISTGSIPWRLPRRFAPRNDNFSSGTWVVREIKSISIETFKVAVDIIGSEKEKWMPTTRETADHSMPYMVVAALLDGDVNLEQYEQKRFLKPDVRALMKRVRVRENKKYSKTYPLDLPVRLSVELENGKTLSKEVLLPRGYAGNPMSQSDTEEKFHRLANRNVSLNRRNKIVEGVNKLEKIGKLKDLSVLMKCEK